MTPQIFTISVMLARVCVSEAGWDAHDECAVIVHALNQQAIQRNVSLKRQICDYAPKSCDQERTRRRWIAFLEPDRRTAPPGWPRLPWEPYRAKFAGMVVTAWETMTGRRASPCPEAFHWGSRHCPACERRMRRRFERIECVGMKNVWYRRRGT